MKNYAISRLREQKNNVISALINAAIPPSTDALSYRDYPSIDLANFRVNLRNWGNRTILALDEEANEIVKRCGPAVRAFLGGSEFYVDPAALKIKSYHEYTILGALNHAQVLNITGRVMAGLQPSHGQSASLDGYMKYPMILLSQDETTAHLGVNFATRITDHILEPAHYEVLKRLVPNFLSYRASYQLSDTNNKRPGGFDAYRYPEERLECPWTPCRDTQLQSRLLSMYINSKAPTVSGKIEAIGGADKLQTMLNAGHEEALKLQRSEIDASKGALFDAVRLLFDNELSGIAQKRQKIYALNQAKYGAKTVTQMLKLMLAANTISAEDFSEAKSLIELINLSIYACRSNLIQETACFDEVLNANKIAQTTAKEISLGYQLAVIGFQLLIELVQSGTQDEYTNELLQRDIQIKQGMIKNLKTQLRDNIASLKKMMEVSEMIAVYDTDYAKTKISPDKAILDFDTALAEFRASHQSQDLPIGKKIEDFFTEILFEANFYYQELKEAVRQNACVFIEDPSWVEGLSLEDKTSSEKKEVVSEAIELWFSELKQRCEVAKVRLNHYSRWSSNKTQIASELDRLKQEIIIRRDKIVASYRALSYSSEKLDDVIHSYLLRAKQQDEFCCLYFLAYDSGCDVRELSLSAKRLYLSYRQACAESAKAVAEDMIRQYERMPRDISWQELREKATIVRQAKEKLELEIRDDVELLELTYNQLYLVYRETFQMVQDMSDIDGRINYFCDHYEFASSSPSPSPSPSSVNEKYLASVDEKVDAILENIRLLGLDSTPFAEHLSLEKESFKKAPESNHVEHIQKACIFFLAKQLKWVNKKYHELYPLDQALELIKVQKERVSVLVHQEPSELLITRKKALRSVKQAYGYIQKVNQSIEQNELGIALPNPIKNSDLVRDILVWSGSLNLHERQWLDSKNTVLSRRQRQQSRDFKTPVRMIYSFFLVMVSDQIIQKRADLGRLRKIQTRAIKLRLGQTSVDSTLLPVQSSMIELRKKLLQLCGQKITHLDMALKELQRLKSQMLSQSLSLFFMEWKRKAFDLPLEVVALKKKCHRLVADVEILPVQEVLDEGNELEYSLDDLEEMLQRLQQYALTINQDEKGSPQKSSSYSMFSDSPNLDEDSSEQKSIIVQRL